MAQASRAETDPDGAGADSSGPRAGLASDYEQARAKEDSLDRLVEWPAQRDLLGDIRGLSVPDAGCGNGGKIAELVPHGGARTSVGVDISDSFITDPPAGLEPIQGDLSDLAAVPRACRSAVRPDLVPAILRLCERLRRGTPHGTDDAR